MSSTYAKQSGGIFGGGGGGGGPTGDLTDTGTDGITITGGTGAVNGSGTQLAQHVADATHNGYLSSTDWSTFNSKQAALTIGNLTDAGTDGITVTGGTGAVIGTGTSIAQHVADTTHNGYLSSTDWNTFNGKQAAGSYITDLTGDVSASGPGSAASTLATVNANVGSFTNASLTVNAKGLVTAASSGTAPVTAVSVATANGLAGTSSGGATPALTLSTSVTGVLKGNGTAISAATSGTDYAPGTSALATGIIKSTTTTGALSIAVAADFPTLNQNTTGTASNVTGTVAIANGGTGQTAKAAAFDALSPMSASGDIVYGGASGTGTRLAKGADGTVLTLASGVPSWAAASVGTSSTQRAAYTPTISGLGTVSGVSFWWWRLGDNLFVQGTFTDGTAAGSLATITLPTSPSALAIDTAKITNTTTTSQCPKVGFWQSPAQNQVGSLVAAVSTSTSLVYFGMAYSSAGGFNLFPQNGNNVLSNNLFITVDFCLPISGWTNNN